MTLDARTLREAVAFGRAVLKVWSSDVVSFVPARFVTLLSGNPKSVTLRLTGDRLTITAVGENAPTETLDPGALDDVERCLERVLGPDLIRRPGVTLVLGFENVLVRQLTRPLLAEASLAKLLPRHLDVLSPWPSDEAWAGWRITERRLLARQVDVDLHVAPRKQIQSLVDMITRLTGGPVNIVSEAHSAGEVGPQLHDLDRPRSVSFFPKVLDGLVFGLPVLLVLLLVYLPLQMDRNYLDTLKSDVEDLQTNRDESLELIKTASDLTREFAALGNQPGAGRSVIETLNLFSATMGDDVWIDHFIVSGGIVELSGSAVDAYVVVASLQKMNDVTDVRFKSPVIQEPQAGRQKFQIELQMGGGK